MGVPENGSTWFSPLELLLKMFIGIPIFAQTHVVFLELEEMSALGKL
jgi:hypothetical protein